MTADNVVVINDRPMLLSPADQKALIGLEDSANLMSMWADNIVRLPSWRTLAERDLEEARERIVRVLAAVDGALEKIKGARRD